MRDGRALGGRRVLVTGGSAGIGAATARAITAAGGEVALLARGERRLRELAEEIGAVAVTADVADPSASARAVDEAADRLGGLDGLVNAAGVLRLGAIMDTDPADWQLLFDVNVRGVLHATRAAVPHLRRAEGTRDVINLSSMSGRRLGSATTGAYAASKAAVHMLSEAMRREFAADAIRVGVIAPGLVQTAIFAEAGPLGEQMGQRAAEVGLTAEVVAASIVHALATPAGVTHVEVAMLSSDQER